VRKILKAKDVITCLQRKIMDY